MTEPATVEQPKPIQKTGTTASGATVSAGSYAIGPSGQLVLLSPGSPLKPGWRFAKQADLDAAAAAEVKRRAKDKSGEHDDRARNAERAASKRAAVEAGGERLTMTDDELAKAHERGDIKHPWPSKGEPAT